MSIRSLRRLGVLCCALSCLVRSPLADLSLHWEEAVLGHALTYELQGDAGDFYIWLPSLTSGPTCLCLFDPLDPRELSVGLDLFSFAQTGILSATGDATTSFPLPNKPALVGVQLFMQAFTLPGVQTVVDDVSNPTSILFSPPGATLLIPNDVLDPRRFASLTPLVDGRVFIAGGMAPDPRDEVLQTAELFDPQTLEFRPAGFLPEPRAQHTATRLPNGRVLLAGGVDDTGAVLNTAVLYNPVTGAFQNAAPMQTARVFHSATLLASGRVLVVGGGTAFTLGHPIGWPASVNAPLLASSEIYNPVTNTWVPGAQLFAPVMAHSAVRLGDNRVLIAGGIEGTVNGPETTDRCSIITAAGGAVTPTALLPAKRFHQARTSTVDGAALVVGGTNVDFSTLNATVHGDTWLYDPIGGNWGVGPLLPVDTRCGELGCTTFTKTINEVGPGCPSPPCEKECTVYFSGGGFESMDISTGQVDTNDALFQIDGDLTGWQSIGDTVLSRPGMRIAPVNDGIRYLLLGSADLGPGVIDVTAELVVPLL